ncbi:hypothetical protein IWQ54_001160 [Labrenzia sp. EL_195]|nr:hypothetical protein [Labrenzia sp. EL_195]
MAISLEDFDLTRMRKIMEDFANEVIEGVVQDVSELPDRASPKDQPEMMLVSANELQTIIWRNMFEPK